MIWFLLVGLFYWLSFKLLPGFSTYISSWWVADTNLLIEELLTTCLQAGVFEEPFFRGVVAYLLLYGCHRPYLQLGTKAIVALVAYSGVLFSAAHIQYDLFPFRILPFDFLQLAVTFVIGCTLTYQYLKTKNIYGSMLAHTVANVIQVLIGFYFAYL